MEFRRMEGGQIKMCKIILGFRCRDYISSGLDVWNQRWKLRSWPCRTEMQRKTLTSISPVLNRRLPTLGNSACSRHRIVHNDLLAGS